MGCNDSADAGIGRGATVRRYDRSGLLVERTKLPATNPRCHVLVARSLTGSAAHHAARSASTIFIRAARIAGRNPPMNPIASAKINETTTMRGVSVNENAISANVWKLVVEIES